MSQTKTEDELKKEAEEKAQEEAKAKAEAEKKAKDEADAKAKAEAEEKAKAEAEVKKQLDDLVKRGILKKEGGVLVEAKFDPTLTPAYKELNTTVVQKISAATDRVAQLEKELEKTSNVLKSKEDMEAADKQRMTEELSKLKSDLTIENQKAREAGIQLLKTQTAVKKGLPFNFLAYVTGETAEAIEASVEKVMGDFALQANKFTKEQLQAAEAAAAEKASKETEEKLKPRGKSTQNAAEPGHIFTREEIRRMTSAEFAANRVDILRQQSEGLIK